VCTPAVPRSRLALHALRLQACPDTPAAATGAWLERLGMADLLESVEKLARVITETPGAGAVFAPPGWARLWPPERRLLAALADPFAASLDAADRPLDFVPCPGRDAAAAALADLAERLRRHARRSILAAAEPRA
jgi:hypothetical protein